MVKEDGQKLDFAYRYPFSNDARELILAKGAGGIQDRYLTAGLLRVNEALNKSRIEFIKTDLTDLKYTYLMSYVYARMLISATGDKSALASYVSAEVNRALEALSDDSLESLTKITRELRVAVKEKNGEFIMNLEDFVEVRQKSEDLRLVNQQLEHGMVHLSREQAVKLLGCAIEKEIGERLPIDRRDLPREIADIAKGIRSREQHVVLGASRGIYSWIEKLLTTPIPDVRHRAVNLILAPYLVNVRKLDEEAAAKIIIDYVEKCKKLNPNTRITDSYIRYQCRYAKNRGLRPLSASRAKDLLAGIVEFE